MFHSVILSKKNATPGEGGQKDIMSRMAEVYFIEFHCIRHLFLCSFVNN